MHACMYVCMHANLKMKSYVVKVRMVKYMGRVATHLENRESRKKSEKNIFDKKSQGKIREIHEKLSVREKFNCFFKCLKTLTSHIPFLYFIKEEELSVLVFSLLYC